MVCWLLVNLYCFIKPPMVEDYYSCPARPCTARTFKRLALSSGLSGRLTILTPKPKTAGSDTV